ncbi:MAG: type VI secretion system ATPase TssH, partial [Anaerolineae bacterium]|nr:type VI secretion system ATPase TssH [Anaerolineae bacterium]
IGSHAIKEQGAEAARSSVMAALDQHFRPEFLNRLDEVILFHNLSKEDIKQIVDIQWRRLEQLLAERRLSITLTDQAREHLAEAGYDPVYGARPLKRAIQHELVDGLALAMLDGMVQEGDHILVDVSQEGSSLTFYPAAASENPAADNIIEGEVVPG